MATDTDYAPAELPEGWRHEGRRYVDVNSQWRKIDMYVARDGAKLLLGALWLPIWLNLANDLAKVGEYWLAFGGNSCNFAIFANYWQIFARSPILANIR